MKQPKSNKGDSNRLEEKLINSPMVIIEPANPLRTPIEELQGLARRITIDNPGINVRFAYNEPREGYYGLTLMEILYIWLPRMEDALLAALVLEVIKAAISWARTRMKYHIKGPRYIYILDENGGILREIRIKDEKTEPIIFIPENQVTQDRKKAPMQEINSNYFNYIVIVTKKYLKTKTLAIIHTPQRIIHAIRNRQEARTKRYFLQIYKEECDAIELQGKLRRFIIEGVCPIYEDTHTKLKENVTYGKLNEAIHFDTVFEHEDGTPFRILHIHFIKNGSKNEEIRRCLEGLAKFQKNIKEYRRIKTRSAMIEFILVIPRKDARWINKIDFMALLNFEGFGIGINIISYEDLKYNDGEVDAQSSSVNS